MDISSLKIEISSSKIGYFREILRKLKKIDFFKRNIFCIQNEEKQQILGQKHVTMVIRCLRRPQVASKKCSNDLKWTLNGSDTYF